MYKDKKYLKRRFIDERKPVKFIAQECNVSVSTIEQYLKRYNLKRGNIKLTKIFRITITNKDFLLSMSEYLNNTIGTNTVVKPDRKYWKIEMVKRDSKLFLDWVYKGYEQFRFLDKYYRYIG